MQFLRGFIILALIFLHAAPLAAQPQKLTIAVQPTATPEQLDAQAKELKDFLRGNLGMDVEIFFPTSYAGVIEALRFGHAQIAFMGSWPALMAVKHAKAEVLLAEIRDVIIDQDKQQMPYYFSYWVVSPESPYQKMEDLRGKRVAFSSPLSTSGYVAPLSKLVEADLVQLKEGQADPKEFFGQVHFAGGYAQAWEALKAGQVDATVIAGDVAEALYNEVLNNTRVLEKQGPVPSHVVMAQQGLDENLKAKIIEALMKLNAPEHQSLMKKFVSGIFVRFEPATAEHLESLDHMLKLTGLEFQEKGK